MACTGTRLPLLIIRKVSYKVNCDRQLYNIWERSWSDGKNLHCLSMISLVQWVERKKLTECRWVCRPTCLRRREARHTACRDSTRSRTRYAVCCRCGEGAVKVCQLVAWLYKNHILLCRVPFEIPSAHLEPLTSDLLLTVLCGPTRQQTSPWPHCILEFGRIRPFKAKYKLPVIRSVTWLFWKWSFLLSR